MSPDPRIADLRRRLREQLTAAAAGATHQRRGVNIAAAVNVDADGETTVVISRDGTAATTDPDGGGPAR